MYVVTQTREVNLLIYVVTHSYVVTQARKVNLHMLTYLCVGGHTSTKS